MIFLVKETKGKSQQSIWIEYGIKKDNIIEYEANQIEDDDFDREDIDDNL